MNINELHDRLIKKFDTVGIIKTETYLKHAKSMDMEVPQEPFQTMVVVGLAYPYRVIKHQNDAFVPSFYTFGRDYHRILKDRMVEVLQNLGHAYTIAVDNHPHNERLAAVLSGIGYFAKNQLIIHPNLGSYFFLGIAFIDVELNHEFKRDITDACGNCRICIDACPPKALSEEGFNQHACMSYFNQDKRILTDQEIKQNYTLFGCDICQMVCPKNIHAGKKVHPEFELSGKEMVQIVDLFQLSEKAFRTKYDDMAYLWKGKTLLMRNAIMLMMKRHIHQYQSLIEASLRVDRPEYFKNIAERAIEQFKKESVDENVK